MTTENRTDLGLKESGAGCACCSSPSAAAEAPLSEAAVTQQILVSGMTCSHCVMSVTEELTALDGVESVAVDLNAGGASRVSVRSSAPVDPAAVEAAVKEAGYALAGHSS
ncbi:cation transporter [Microbacterium sp. LRZ72]|uniref:heavy-metal-associated domain-containing protein n=1 Tax=Microbacterium sp. LRZ72 TaxID=2942481 RepID=UPI0029B4077A|nr:cation transporter [Microbacterium sp. LRZ72]MDX2377717.1 cation transporter [Microbacterium sp. LRZ72]